MRRRDFIVVMLGSAVSRPLAALARGRRVDVLMLYAENDPEGQKRAIVFRQELERLGWTVGGDLQVDYRWGTGDSEWIRRVVDASLRTPPDLIVANGSPATRVAQQATRSVPIVFIGGGGDPVADGFVQSLAHPGGNMTGFTVLEPSLGAKLLGLLKEIAPQATRIAVLLNPESPSSQRFFSSAAAGGPTLGITVISVAVRDRTDIESAINRLASESGGGLIIPSDPVTNAYRELIDKLALSHRLPAIYALRAAVVEGGLLSYGVDLPDLFRKAATYADRILRGEKPADLPVQRPAKFELVINLKTAAALGIEVPGSLLARADEVIE
jgi:putative ABC transport system substrate-binding protein